MGDLGWVKRCWAHSMGTVPYVLCESVCPPTGGGLGVLRRVSSPSEDTVRPRSGVSVCHCSTVARWTACADDKENDFSRIFFPGPVLQVLLRRTFSHHRSWPGPMAGRGFGQRPAPPYSGAPLLRPRRRPWRFRGGRRGAGRTRRRRPKSSKSNAQTPSTFAAGVWDHSRYYCAAPSS